MSAANNQLWISLIEVEGLVGNSSFRMGEKSFVNGLVMASSREEAERRLSRALSDLRFHVVSLEATEQFHDRLASGYSIEPELRILARIVEREGRALFGTFHTWDHQG